MKQKPFTARKFSAIDLLRFRDFANENPDMKPIELLREYHKKYPELSTRQKIKNIESALGVSINQLIQEK